MLAASTTASMWCAATSWISSPCTMIEPSALYVMKVIPRRRRTTSMASSRETTLYSAWISASLAKSTSMWSSASSRNCAAAVEVSTPPNPGHPTDPTEPRAPHSLYETRGGSKSRGLSRLTGLPEVLEGEAVYGQGDAQRRAG